MTSAQRHAVQIALAMLAVPEAERTEAAALALGVVFFDRSEWEEAR